MALPIALRGSDGIWMVNGPPQVGTKPNFQNETSSRCRVMTFSRDGSLFAWCNSEVIHIVQTGNFEKVVEINKPKTSCLQFSPKGSILATWEPYTVDRETNQGVANLCLWDVASGQLLKSLVQKKQSNWCPQWTDDEEICCRNVNNELHFFEKNDFSEIKQKLHLQKVAEFSVCPAGPPYMVAGYVPGAKGQPSFARAYKYPNFAGPNSAIANRTFMKADKMEMKWNKVGNALLTLTATETSEQSYYGDSGLHYIGMNGESSLVHLGKNGPVYHIEWSPKSNEFCVVYGFMPAKATIYNLKAEPVFDFGTGPRNFGYYNPQGNILCLCGFGNLRGNMEFWDVKQKRLIAQTQSPDTTSFEWCADGEHVLTATTAPRLRVGNGYRIWHYSGVMIDQGQIPQGKELWEVQWQPVLPGILPEKTVQYRPVQSDIAPPQQEVKTGAYRPPGARGQPASVKLHEYEAPSNMKQPQNDPSKPMSKNKKKKEARKARAEQEGGASSSAPMEPQSQPQQPMESTGDPEKDKKIRNLRKKLQQIEKLKEQQAAGKNLEVNQMEKLKTEESLLTELQQLEIR